MAAVLMEFDDGADGLGGPGPGAPLGVVGDWLAATQRAHDRWRAAWLTALADFDRAQGWAIDGQCSCAEWLQLRAGTSRAAAFEYLRVAHELERRPVVAAAFAAGRASYSAVRSITRAEGASPEVDEALVDLAEAGGVADVDRAVRAYRRYADQDRPPGDPTRRRTVRFSPQGDGTTKVEAILTDLEAEELRLTLERIAADPDPVDESTVETPSASSGEGQPQGPIAPAAGPVDESTVETPAGAEGPEGSGVERVPWWQRLADALVALARLGRTARDAGSGADRYMVHLVVEHGETCILGGEPLGPEAAATIACDCSTVVHHRSAAGEPLALGRRTHPWSTAQRRGIAARDHGRCRWPVCQRRHTDVHHLVPWEHGGPTDTNNGILLCPRHHTRIHQGFTTTGIASGALTFHRPDGTPVGTTRP